MKMLSLSKRDKFMVDDKAMEWVEQLDFAKECERDIFIKDTKTMFNSLCILAKAVREQINELESVDLLSKDLNFYYKEANYKMEEWCKKYKSEIKSMQIGAVVKVMFRHIDTHEDFIFWINGSDLAD